MTCTVFTSLGFAVAIAAALPWSAQIPTATGGCGLEPAPSSLHQMTIKRRHKRRKIQTGWRTRTCQQTAGEANPLPPNTPLRAGVGVSKGTLVLPKPCKLAAEHSKQRGVSPGSPGRGVPAPRAPAQPPEPGRAAAPCPAHRAVSAASAAPAPHRDPCPEDFRSPATGRSSKHTKASQFSKHLLNREMRPQPS